jgi:hypothetical protein
MRRILSAFPSGHSIAAWSLATVIANEYHDRPLVQITAYGIAGAVSVARFDLKISTAAGTDKFQWRKVILDQASGVTGWRIRSSRRIEGYRWPACSQDLFAQSRSVIESPVLVS